jgi:hypothetical protein
MMGWHNRMPFLPFRHAKHGRQHGIKDAFPLRRSTGVNLHLPVTGALKEGAGVIHAATI